MFGREMKLELAGNPMSFNRVKDFVQDSQSMGVEIVKHQSDQLQGYRIKIESALKMRKIGTW